MQVAVSLFPWADRQMEIPQTRNTECINPLSIDSITKSRAWISKVPGQCQDHGQFDHYNHRHSTQTGS